jgi:hypothetical protein
MEFDQQGYRKNLFPWQFNKAAVILAHSVEVSYSFLPLTSTPFPS